MSYKPGNCTMIVRPVRCGAPSTLGCRCCPLAMELLEAAKASGNFPPKAESAALRAEGSSQ